MPPRMCGRRRALLQASQHAQVRLEIDRVRGQELRPDGTFVMRPAASTQPPGRQTSAPEPSQFSRVCRTFHEAENTSKDARGTMRSAEDVDGSSWVSLVGHAALGGY